VVRRRPDLVDRDFSASGRNELWVAGLTYLRCWEGVVYFAFILDAYSRRVVGWQVAGHMRTTLVLDALRMALHQRGRGADVELVHHAQTGNTDDAGESDRGVACLYGRRVITGLVIAGAGLALGVVSAPARRSRRFRLAGWALFAGCCILVVAGIVLGGAR
jgi:hypothetical protein